MIALPVTAKAAAKKIKNRTTILKSKKTGICICTKVHLDGNKIRLVLLIKVNTINTKLRTVKAPHKLRVWWLVSSAKSEFLKR